MWIMLLVSVRKMTEPNRVLLVAPSGLVPLNFANQKCEPFDLCLEVNDLNVVIVPFDLCLEVNEFNVYVKLRL